VQLAAAFGIPGRRVESAGGLPAAFAAAVATEGPYVLDCRVDEAANVYPMVAPGSSNADFVEDPQAEGLA
jgi:acetolactate synthase-1/2/3 large subunit